MTTKIGTLGDRIANRLVRHFPHRTLPVSPAMPLVSFTFDDAPESAWKNGAGVLEDHGGRGTYYIAGALAGRVGDAGPFIGASGCTDLAARGHELASHTFSHRKLADYAPGRLLEDLDRNDAYLAQFDGRTGPRNFAVPFTMASPTIQPLLRKHFRTSRGGQRGVNRGLVDPHYLSVLELRPETPAAEVAAVYDEMEREPGWLIVFTHDISDAPSAFGYARSEFAGLVGEAVRRGFVLATVDAAMDRLTGMSNPSTMSA